MFDDEQAAINSFFPDREVRRFDILEFVQDHDAEKQTPRSRILLNSQNLAKREGRF